jgi:hypothetical protein
MMVVAAGEMPLYRQYAVQHTPRLETVEPFNDSGLVRSGGPHPKAFSRPTYARTGSAREILTVNSVYSGRKSRRIASSQYIVLEQLQHTRTELAY